MNHVTILFAMIVALTLFSWNRIPAVVVSIGVSLALFFTGILTVTQAWDDFGDLAVIFISSLFVVAAGVEASGITSRSSQFIIVSGSKTNSPAVVFMMIAAFFCPTTSFSGTVVALLPCLVVWRFLGKL